MIDGTQNGYSLGDIIIDGSSLAGGRILQWGSSSIELIGGALYVVKITTVFFKCSNQLQCQTFESMLTGIGRFGDLITAFFYALQAG